MVDDVNWDICFLFQDSVGLFTLVHQKFLLLFLIYIRTVLYFRDSSYKEILFHLFSWKLV